MPQKEKQNQPENAIFTITAIEPVGHYAFGLVFE